jgi:hypothetical protein
MRAFIYNKNIAMHVKRDYKRHITNKGVFMKAYIFVIVSMALPIIAYAGPSISGSPMNGPQVVCTQDSQRGLWIYQVGFHANTAADKFEGYYMDNGTSKGPFDCKFVNDNESKLIWDCSASSITQNGASAQLIVNDDGKLEMQFFAKDKIQNPAPTDTVFCDVP